MVGAWVCWIDISFFLKAQSQASCAALGEVHSCTNMPDGSKRAGKKRPRDTQDDDVKSKKSSA